MSHATINNILTYSKVTGVQPLYIFLGKSNIVPRKHFFLFEFFSASSERFFMTIHVKKQVLGVFGTKVGTDGEDELSQVN